MLPAPKIHRFLPFLLMALALVFIVRQPDKAAAVATGAVTGLMTVTDALVTFASSLG
ncbi:cell division protein FtsW (lipid II flippase) [Streptosporangium becharense]|uniref:Cell division protein FtsW (Lipid II flippase) n=1 Tax=Streptosporangium becharense TaxID=1816182 RepID=A0A7W9MG79_9ACTN|nr:hypothetical protein [Streptosporangium becharense]MBB2909159.1 cell division protein FtsW (lipid II flippase) [Streptosporangium becharense]MBB5819822.1 cell division protein FtsW (lipid II flippase) [Streptosporangium becharense]